MIKFDRKRIAELREQSGLSVSDCAEKVGVSRQRWDAWESRGGVCPSMDGFEKICNAFEVDPAYFFTKKLAREQTNAKV